MFCTKCGKQIPDSTKFCPFCGADCSMEKNVANQASHDCLSKGYFKIVLEMFILREF